MTNLVQLLEAHGKSSSLQSNLIACMDSVNDNRVGDCNGLVGLLELMISERNYRDRLMTDIQWERVVNLLGEAMNKFRELTNLPDEMIKLQNTFYEVENAEPMESIPIQQIVAEANAMQEGHPEAGAAFEEENEGDEQNDPDDIF
jgi:hypothetical protein